MMRSAAFVIAVLMIDPFGVALAQSKTPNIIGPDRKPELLDYYHKGEFSAAWLSIVSSPWESVFTAAIALNPECKPGSPIIGLRRLLAASEDAQAQSVFEELYGRSYESTVSELRNRVGRDFGRPILAAIDQAVAARQVAPTSFPPPPDNEASPCGASSDVYSAPAQDPMSELTCISARELRAHVPSAKNTSYLNDMTKISVDTSSLRPPIRGIVLDNILRSLALWTAACSNCSTSAFAVLEDSDAFYLPSPIVRLAQEGRLASPFTAPAMGSPVIRAPAVGSPVVRAPAMGTPVGRGRGSPIGAAPAMGAQARSSQDSGRAGTFGWVTSVKLRDLLGSLSRSGAAVSDFVREPKGSQELTALCASKFDKSLAGLHTALCDQGVSSSTFNVALAEDGYTLCIAPNGKRVVACEDPTVGVQLNTKDFRFKDPYAREFGSGVAVDLGRIMLHEMGHWLGHMHTDSRNGIDIMTPEYTDAMCFSETDVFLMEANDLAVPPKFPQGMSLIK